MFAEMAEMLKFISLDGVAHSPAGQTRPWPRQLAVNGCLLHASKIMETGGRPGQPGPVIWDGAIT